ncbi:MAG: acyloxyacyl hydrolase [Muribaculaceae bacterium]|nr:acyloxyacyl hydrolase [Muribaculaceae bacterium]
MRNKLILLLAFAFMSVNFPAYPEIRSEVSFDSRSSYAFSSFRDDIMQNSLLMEDARITHFAEALHLKYGFTFSPDSKEGRFFPGVWQGVGIGANLFGNSKGIGTPVSVYAFQGAPVYNISDQLAVYYEWNFGLAAGWKPCNGVEAYSNLIVGSRVNAYINLGAGLRWKIKDNYFLTAGLDLTHYSNGNTSYPNPGVNLAGIRVGITRTFGTPETNHVEARQDTAWKKKRFGVDVTAYGAWRKRVYRGGEEPVLLRGHFMVAGMDINPMWNTSRIIRVGGSLDMQWDESTDLKRNHAEGTTTEDIYFYRPDAWRQICLGISARGELVMPIFSVNIGIGYNVIGPEETRASYQMANLKIRVVKGLYANIGYQLLNFQKQNNLMLGLGYSFR